MATKTLPVTGIELPSDEWEMRNYKQNLAFSEETLCFTATIVHLPTKTKMEARNDGHGGADFIFWDQTQPKVQEAQIAWKQFIADCTPVMQASVANDPNEWVRGIYDNGASEESVIGLFTNELSNQKMLSGKRGLVIRKNPTDDEYTVYRPGVTLEQLAGKVAGEYWDKKTKNWVAL